MASEKARWLVSVPVWGERYVAEFCAASLPTIDRAVAALSATGVEVRVVAYTDQPERVVGAGGPATECRPVPAGARDFDCMSQAHRDTLSLALRGDVVVLLTAGTVISEQGLVYCAEVLLNSQLQVVLCAVPRVLQQGQLPDTADAGELMRWSWDNRHPMTNECTFPEGRSVDLSRTYYVSPAGAVATRVFLPHPLAVRIDGRPMRFTPTVDCNLMNCFDSSEMHMATTSGRLAVVKLTPADKGYELAEATMAARMLEGLLVSDKHQLWCAGHRVVLCEGDLEGCEDNLLIESIRGSRRT